jgi:hypothetical protein
MAKPDLQEVRVNPRTGALRTLKGKLGLGQSRLDQLGDHANDSAAATAGVPIGGLYRTGSTLKVRVA